jgi:GNAT superfamily N-acetyltransferase
MIEIYTVDWLQPTHASGVLAMVQAYALEATAGEGLEPAVEARLIPGLRMRPDYVGVLALDRGQAVGLVNAFEGFSTFMARPLLNVHDVYVVPNRRGQGLAPRMLQSLQSLAVARGCCKLTLEVLEHNLPAIASYRQFGFEPYALDPAQGRATFWEKRLSLDSIQPAV